MHKYAGFEKKPLCILFLCGLVMITLMAGCGFLKNTFTPKEMEPPSVKLTRVEVARDWGWWFYAENKPTTRGKAGNHGAPLLLAFIYQIKNPNNYPVKMDKFNFAVEFNNTKLDEIKLNDVMWIPSGQVNDLRTYSLLDPQSVRLNLLVEKGAALKKKDDWLFSELKKYWTEIPQLKNPISVTNGTAEFKAKNKSKIITFSAAYSKKTEKKETEETPEPGKDSKAGAEE
jgi:hypothetical protein